MYVLYQALAKAAITAVVDVVMSAIPSTAFVFFPYAEKLV